MNAFKQIQLFLCLTLMLGIHNSISSQNAPQGFFYQTNVKTLTGLNLINASVGIRFSLYSNSPSGAMVWQEDHALLTDENGLATTVIGSGISTGAGTLIYFNQIEWSLGLYYLKVSIDISGGSSFADFGSSQLFSVPYSLYSMQTSAIESISLANLLDVDTLGNSVGKLLKWNGNYWAPSIDNDSDTVLYAFQSNHSSVSDTAFYTYGALASDTVFFAYNTDSASYSLFSSNSIYAVDANYADTAYYAFESSPSAWMQSGNTVSSGNYFGVNDNTDLIFRTNNLPRAKLKSNGGLVLGQPIGSAFFTISGNDGILVTGSLGAAFSPVNGSGTRMLWYPSKASFRAGSVSSSLWDDSNIGNYSIAVGYDTKARLSSFASGFQSKALDYSIAIGRKSQANASKAYPYGNSIALGDSCVSNAQRSVAIGYGNLNDSTLLSNISSSVSIGFMNRTRASVTLCLGSFCNSNVGANWSTAIGFHATTAHIGSFVFSDASSSAATISSAANQFLVRANGGIVFYTDSLNTMAVTLAPGSGSWSTISDRNKKENFSELNYETILDGINKLNIKRWNYKSQSESIRHIGPMAQKFYETFKVGENNTSISTSDIDGVILSGIKGLSNIIEKLDNLNEVDQLKLKIEKINFSTDYTDRINKIEAFLDAN
jgi:hypothetical protein